MAGLTTSILVCNQHARLSPTHSACGKRMLGWHAEAQPKDKQKEKRHASKAVKCKAVADVNSAGADAATDLADQSQAEAAGEQLAGSMPAEANGPPAAEAAAQAAVPMADDGDAAAQSETEAHALPTGTEAKRKKRKKKKLEDEANAAASHVEPAGEAQSADVALGSFKKKSSKVWPSKGCPGSVLPLTSAHIHHLPTTIRQLL